MNIFKRIAWAVPLTIVALVAGLVPALAADPVNPIAGISNFYKIPADLVDKIPAQLAPFYLAIMNGLILAAMVLFGAVTFMHAVKALKVAFGKNEGGITGDNTTPMHALRGALIGTVQSGLITLIVLIAILKGAEILMGFANGAELSLGVAPTEGVKLFGPLFGPMAAQIMTFGSYGIIIAALVYMGVRGVQAISGSGQWTGHIAGSGAAGGSFDKAKSLVTDLVIVTLIAILGFLALRAGPGLIAQGIDAVQHIQTGKP